MPKKPTRTTPDEILYAGYSGHPLTKFPAETKKFINLETLGLSRTKFTKFPTEILKFSKLQKLDISMTPIIEIPEGISKLTNLKQLTLSYNYHIDLPKSLAELKNLTKLLMFYQYKLTAIPESVGNTLSLKELLLGSSDLLKDIPENIGNLKKLQTLDLDNCKALTYLPESIGNCTNLKVLKIGDTSIKKLPASISKLTKLEELYINIHTLDLEDAFEKIKDLPKLTFLAISLQPSYPKNIKELKNITHLHVAQNWPRYHEGHEKTALAEEILLMPNLESLSLDGNNHVNALPKNIDKLKKLKRLAMSATSIKTVPENLKKLKMEVIYGDLENRHDAQFGLQDGEREKIQKWFPKAEVYIS